MRGHRLEIIKAIEGEESLSAWYKFIAADGWEIYFLVLAVYRDDGVHYLYSFLSETLLILLLRTNANVVCSAVIGKKDGPPILVARHTEAMKSFVDTIEKLDLVDDGNEIPHTMPNKPSNLPAFFQLNKFLPISQAPSGGNKEPRACEICGTAESVDRVSYRRNHKRTDIPQAPPWDKAGCLCKACYGTPTRTPAHQERLVILRAAAKDEGIKTCVHLNCCHTSENYAKNFYATQDSNGNPGWECSRCRMRDLKGLAEVHCADCPAISMAWVRPFFNLILCPTHNKARLKAIGCSVDGTHQQQTHQDRKWYHQDGLVFCHNCHMAMDYHGTLRKTGSTPSAAIVLKTAPAARRLGGPQKK